MKTELKFRSARASDIDDINEIVRQAVQSWGLSERVKRLSLSSYLYNELDLRHLHLIVALSAAEVVGTIALDKEHAEKNIAHKSLLIHGLFIKPQYQKTGIGTYLFKQAMQTAQQLNYSALIVRAQKDASGFFEKMGMRQLAVKDGMQDYARRYWMRID